MAVPKKLIQFSNGNDLDKIVMETGPTVVSKTKLAYRLNIIDH